LIAAGWFAPAPVTAQTLPVVRVATTLNDSGAEVYYAQDMGFFEKAGLHVEIVTLNSAGLLGSSVASGALDFAETGLSVIATAHQKGLPFVIVAPAGQYSSKAPTTALVALKNSPLKSGSDLNGRTIAVRDINSPAYVGARIWIDQSGGDSKSVKFVEVPDYDVAGALAQGRIDGAVISEPDLQNALAAERSASFRSSTTPSRATFSSAPTSPRRHMRKRIRRSFVRSPSPWRKRPGGPTRIRNSRPQF